MRAWLEARLTRALEGTSRALDAEVTFQELGLGSIELVEITGELAAAFGLELPNTFFYDRTTISAVAEALEARLGQSSEVARAASAETWRKTSSYANDGPPEVCARK